MSSTAKSSSNITIGSLQIVIGLVISFFTYAHRPPDGLMDAMQRSDSWAFKPQVYYGILLIAALFGLAGILRIVKGTAKSVNSAATAPSGTSNLEEIKKAKELLDAGAITFAEFEKIKSNAIGR